MARTLAEAVDQIQRDQAGAPEDPFAGVISERALLYSGHRSGPWGFDGTPGSAERVHIHRDGYSSAHVGAASIEPEEPMAERLVRVLHLDRDEAALLRDVFARPGDGTDTRAGRLGISVRTCRRRDLAVRRKVEEHRAAIVGLEAE